jgi:nucleotide-binding universal stress UspA family protein
MKIILAVDDSEFSFAATDVVKSRQWPPGTEVRVLSAVEQVPPPAAALWYDAQGSLEGAHRRLSNHAAVLTQGAVEALRAAGLNAESVVREGDPRSVIVDEAKDWDADLIVLGSHGYTGLKRWLLGSVAQFVVNHAPCSVEVVRQKVGEGTQG